MTFTRKANTSIVEAVGFKSETFSGLNNLAALKARIPSRICSQNNQSQVAHNQQHSPFHIGSLYSMWLVVITMVTKHNLEHNGTLLYAY